MLALVCCIALCAAVSCPAGQFHPPTTVFNEGFESYALGAAIPDGINIHFGDWGSPNDGGIVNGTKFFSGTKSLYQADDDGDDVQIILAPLSLGVPQSYSLANCSWVDISLKFYLSNQTESDFYLYNDNDDNENLIEVYFEPGVELWDPSKVYIYWNNSGIDVTPTVGVINVTYEAWHSLHVTGDFESRVFEVFIDGESKYRDIIESPTVGVMEFYPRNSGNQIWLDDIVFTTYGACINVSTSPSPSPSVSPAAPAPPGGAAALVAAFEGLSQAAQIGIGVGIGVGVPVLILTIVLVAFFCCCRKKDGATKSESNDAAETGSDVQDSAATSEVQESDVQESDVQESEAPDSDDEES
jgi:hypothetical protein